MKYYKLIDQFNLNEIIKETDDGKWFRYYYGVERWVETGIMVRYEWPEDVFYDKYITISDEEANRTIEQNRSELIKQLSLAEKIAKEAHNGQLDKGGNPYINHPIFVADSLQNIEHKIVALLHDVCEDSRLTINDLLEMGFSKRIAQAVNVLTKNKKISYDDYLAEIKKDSNACPIKIADLKHNMDISRIQNPTQNDLDRMKKYKKSLTFLEK
jgi:(p)ppGpp synthase/HD superfamily hydrolase